MGELTIVVKPALQLPTIKVFTPKIMLELISKPFSKDSHINATHDLEAVHAWLEQHCDNKKTFIAYKREAERLLLWCVYVRGLTLGQLKAEDFTTFFEFLKMPPSEWCITRRELRAGKANEWRPFLGPLSQTAFNLAVRVINSLMNFLVMANYLRFNPLKLTRKVKDFPNAIEEQRYNIWARMLEEDEWEAIEQTLEDLPEANDRQIANKIRTQFLFAMLYLLGLRIHELATHRWNAFRCIEGNWYFFVKGKGGKLGHIPVHAKLLALVKIYRLQLGKMPLPEVDDVDPLLALKHTKNPLSIRQSFDLVKTVGKIAAQQFVTEPRKQQKLSRLSPHWLRHVFASKLAKAGVPVTMIQDYLRHGSIQITKIYMHAEEALRHSEIQKLDFNVTPKLKEIEELPQETTVVMTISLKGGSICDHLSLERLLDSIENNVFKDIAWELKEQSRESLLKTYKQVRIYNQPLLITYQLYNIHEDKLAYIKCDILREADIRLFCCDIKINNSLLREGMGKC